MSWHCLLATTVGTFSTPPWSWARIGVPHVPEQLSHGCLLTPLMAQPPATVGHASWNLLQLRPARLQPARPRMIQREGRSCLACSLLPVAPPEPVTPLQSMAHDSNCKALQGSARLCKALQGRKIQSPPGMLSLPACQHSKSGGACVERVRCSACGCCLDHFRATRLEPGKVVHWQSLSSRAAPRII